MKKQNIYALLLLFALAVPGAAEPAASPQESKRPLLRERYKGRVVYHREYISGKWVFEYEYRGNVKDFHPYEYENGSNSQKIVTRTDDAIVMRNIADLSPFSSKAPFPAGEYYKKNPVKNAPPRPVKNRSFLYSPPYDPTFLSTEEIRPDDLTFLKNTAETITKESLTQSEAVESVMEYLRANVSYALGSSTYAPDVIRTGRAFCVGYADAAVYLLRSIGIPARSMSCNVPPGFGWGFGNAGGDHAYVEVYYSDIGWVSYDPQQSVHFVDPYHVTYAPDAHGLPWGISLCPGKSYRNFTAVIKDDPIFNTYYHQQYIRIRSELLASSGKRIIPCRLIGPPEGTYLLTKTGGLKSGEEMRSFTSSIDGIYNNEFYISMASGGPATLRLQSSANGLAITRDIAVSGEEKSIMIDLFREGKNFIFTKANTPMRGQKIEIHDGKNNFSLLGTTDRQGALLTNMIKNEKVLIRYKDGYYPDYLYRSIEIKDGASAALDVKLNAREYLANFIRVHETLGTPVAIVGKITLPKDSPLYTGELTCVYRDGNRAPIPVNTEGYFEHKSDKRHKSDIERLIYRNRCFYASAKVTSRENRCIGSFDFDFTLKASTVITEHDRVCVYSPSETGYLFSPVVPVGKKIYIVTDENRCYLGSTKEASDITAIDLKEGSSHTLAPVSAPESVVSAYSEFNKNISRKEEWSAIGYMRDESGNTITGYDLYLQEGNNYTQFTPNRQGLFVIYAKQGISQRIVLRKDGYYYKSPELKGATHFNIIADFSAGAHITVRQKTVSAENSLYIFQKNNPVGLARFARDGSLRIYVAGEYSVSRNSDEKTSVRVSRAGGEKDLAI